MKEKANAFGVEEETKKERETAVSSSKIPSKEAAAVLRHIGAAVLRTNGVRWCGARQAVAEYSSSSLRQLLLP